MKEKILEISDKLRLGFITTKEACDQLGLLLETNKSSCDYIFEKAAEVDDYEFNLNQNWKEDNGCGYDSKAIGGFKD